MQAFFRNLLNRKFDKLIHEMMSSKYMKRALKIARTANRDVAPNPMVGAVIVKNGKIIGEGYHQKFGEAHAEVNAISSIKNKSDLIGATIYVTLEPCRHHGKTPPCQDLIDSVGISHIVCASHDPFQKGVRSKNLEFIGEELEKEANQLNKFFFTWIGKKRPFVTVKIATSADGFVAGEKGQAIHFTSPTQDRQVHKLRTEHQAIMVGSNTVLNDDPALTVRHVKGIDPLRIILDSKKRIPKTAKVFADKNYLYITKRQPLKKTLAELATQNISSVLVEPGPTLYAQLKKEGLIDDLIILKGMQNLKKGTKIDIF